MTRFWQPTRRDVLHCTAVGVTGASVSGWLGALAADALKGKTPNKSVILLWMNGGPATIDMWDLKPGHDNGGPFKEIATAVNGVRISEHLPRLAKWAKDMALVRSMSTKEGDHGRASFLLRTGYTPQASIQFPALGSLVANEIGREGTDLPNFVSIASNRSGVLGAGSLARITPRYSWGKERPGQAASRYRIFKPLKGSPLRLSLPAWACSKD